MSRVAFTIVAKNYFSQALALRDSFLNSDPSCKFVIFLCDRVTADFSVYVPEEVYTIVTTAIVPDFEKMSFKYDVVELCTAVKPFCFLWLLKQHSCDACFYFDPDIWLFNSLERLERFLDTHPVMVTPHICFPSNDSLAAVPQDNFLSNGVFNLGFIGISAKSADAIKVMEWWAEQLKNNSYVDKSRGLFYDQKWMDLLPAFLGDKLFVFRAPGANVAPWNIHERVVEKSDEGRYSVCFRSQPSNPESLLFFHFSGFDPYQPLKMDKRDSNNGLYDIVPGSPLASLYYDYSINLLSRNYSELRKCSYSYSCFDNGVLIQKIHRRIYRAIDESSSPYRFEDEYQQSLKPNLQLLREQFVNPFLVDSRSFYCFLNKSSLISKKIKFDLEREILSSYKAYTRKIRIMVLLYRYLLLLFGVKYFVLLLRFLERYSRPEALVGILKIEQARR